MFATGTVHTCATKKADESLWCWGQDIYGQVGDGASAEDHAKLPTAVLGLSAGVVEVAAYARHTCARTSDGGLFCWGEGSHGELGNGSMANADTAQPVVLPCR
jgi:alpha-tubulin suppressor-like RCC1 family protein